MDMIWDERRSNKTPAQAFTRATDFCNVHGMMHRAEINVVMKKYTMAVVCAIVSVFMTNILMRATSHISN